MCCKYFSHFVSIYFVSSSLFCHAKNFYLHIVKFISPFFIVSGFWVIVRLSPYQLTRNPLCGFISLLPNRLDYTLVYRLRLNLIFFFQMTIQLSQHHLKKKKNPPCPVIWDNALSYTQRPHTLGPPCRFFPLHGSLHTCACVAAVVRDPHVLMREESVPLVSPAPLLLPRLFLCVWFSTWISLRTRQLLKIANIFMGITLNW